MTGDDRVDESGVVWVVTSRCIPRQGRVSEELTICYGEEYSRQDYEEDYWAMEPPPKTKPSAQDMATIIRNYCIAHNVNYSDLVRAYGV